MSLNKYYKSGNVFLFQYFFYQYSVLLLKAALIFIYLNLLRLFMKSST